jgi:hypothetical protein
MTPPKAKRTELKLDCIQHLTQYVKKQQVSKQVYKYIFICGGGEPSKQLNERAEKWKGRRMVKRI